MTTLKEQIIRFIIPYISETGKPIETITEYKKYDMNLIASHRNLILSFINSHFNIRNDLIQLDELLYDKEYNLWNDFNSLKDLDILEALVGLLIAVGLIEDSLITRWNSLNEIQFHRHEIFLFRDNFLLDDREIIDIYLEVLKNYILPFYKFRINKNTYEYMVNLMPGRTFDNSIKQKILAWINSSSLEITKEDLRIVNDFLNHNPEGFLNTIVISFNDEDGVDSLIKYLRSDYQFNCLNARIGVMVSNFTESQRQELEHKKKLFLDKIKLPEDKKRKLQ